MLGRIFFVFAFLSVVVLILYVRPYASDRAREVAPLGVAVMLSWAVFNGMLLAGLQPGDWRIIAAAWWAEFMTVLVGIAAALATKAEGIDKEALMEQMGMLQVEFEKAVETIEARGIEGEMAGTGDP